MDFRVLVTFGGPAAVPFAPQKRLEKQKPLPFRSGLWRLGSCSPSTKSYAYLVAPNPPTRQERQMPNVLPLPIMFVQRFLMLANSCSLSVALKNGVSVTARPCTPGAVWMVVPYASIPFTIGKAVPPIVASAALLVQVVPVKVSVAPVFTSFMTTELGRTPVRVLLIRSLVTESETNPFGVIRQEQQEINCSSGEKA